MGNAKPPLLKLQPFLSLCACFIPYKEESTHLGPGILILILVRVLKDSKTSCLAVCLHFVNFHKIK